MYMHTYTQYVYLCRNVYMHIYKSMFLHTDLQCLLTPAVLVSGAPQHQKQSERKSDRGVLASHPLRMCMTMPEHIFNTHCYFAFKYISHMFSIHIVLICAHTYCYYLLTSCSNVDLIYSHPHCCEARERIHSAWIIWITLSFDSNTRSKRGRMNCICDNFFHSVPKWHIPTRKIACIHTLNDTVSHDVTLYHMTWSHVTH